jgi:uncharacterized protein (DUF1778 family)
MGDGSPDHRRPAGVDPAVTERLIARVNRDQASLTDLAAAVALRGLADGTVQAAVDNLAAPTAMAARWVEHRLTREQAQS